MELYFSLLKFETDIRSFFVKRYQEKCQNTIKKCIGEMPKEITSLCLEYCANDERDCNQTPIIDFLFR